MTASGLKQELDLEQKLLALCPFIFDGVLRRVSKARRKDIGKTNVKMQPAVGSYRGPKTRNRNANHCHMGALADSERGQSKKIQSHSMRSFF